MDKYLYSLVRCVPDPRTGEFINLGAVAGNPETGEWSVRQVTNESRARGLAGPRELGAVHDLLARIGFEIDHSKVLLEAGDAEPLGEDWLAQLHHDHRNVVQLSSPTPMVAAGPEEALDALFEHMIIDPVSVERRQVTKSRVVAGLRAAYGRASIDQQMVHRRARIFVGDRVQTPIDFAIANGSTVQLTQCWSFQLSGVEDVATSVKAWAYALRGLRNGDEARVETQAHPHSLVARDVDIEVVVAGPQSERQRAAFAEAEQVFSELDVQVRSLDDVTMVADRAVDLVRVATADSAQLTETVDVRREP